MPVDPIQTIRKIGHFNFLSTHITEAIIIAIVTILLLFWSRPKKDKIRREKHEGVLVEIVSDSESCDKVLTEFLSKDSGSFMIGFDAEWTPAMNQFHNKSYKIGLLQLATNKNIILIRLNKMNYTIPNTLKSLLENNKILKCGVGIHEDVTKIYRDFDIKTVGVIELNDIYKLSSYFDTKNTKTKGLKSLCKLICDKPMKYKQKSITLSHWNTFDELHIDQIQYAADDAIIAIKIFLKLMDDIFGIIDSSEYITECADYIDVLELKKQKIKDKTSNDIKSIQQQKIINKSKANRIKQRQNESKDAIRYKILKLDGSILFYCGKFRFEWFLANNLGTKVNDTSCKLLFIGDYDSKEESKDNICFVCGQQGTDINKIEINRFNIFNDCYWRHLQNEEIQQKALYGNMIPLCHKTENDCLLKAKQSKMNYIRYFCELYPNITIHPELVKSNIGYKKARSSANALHKCHLSIPINRKIELVKCVADYFGLKYDEMNGVDTHYNELLNITECKMDNDMDMDNSKDVSNDNIEEEKSKQENINMDIDINNKIIENNNDENKNDIKMINDLEASVSSSEDEESSYDSNINYSYNINRHKYKYKNKNKCNNVNRSRLLSPPINHYNVFKENHNN
eukprot:279220_1